MHLNHVIELTVKCLQIWEKVKLFLGSEERFHIKKCKIEEVNKMTMGGQICMLLWSVTYSAEILLGFCQSCPIKLVCSHNR